MGHREWLNAALRFERSEGVCQFEWGYWPETVERWRAEGMEGGEPWEALPITFYHRVPVHVRIFPEFEYEVLEDRPDTQIVRDENGIVKEVRKHGQALPHFIRHPVADMRDFEELKERLDPNTPGRFPPDWRQQADDLAQRDSILVMGRTEISFFGWHRDLMGAENLLVAYYDQPELVHAISRHHLAFLKELYSRILEDVEFDFVFLWEDMSYRNGPLISPTLVREFMLPYYRELIGFFRDFGDYKFLVDSDGDVTALIPPFMEAGIDGMLPFEVAAGMDIRRIAGEFPDLIMSGGIDKREMAKGREAIDRELEAKLPPLFRRGGYFPSMDHHVPPDVSYADFQYYLARVRELHAQHGRAQLAVRVLVCEGPEPAVRRAEGSFSAIGARRSVGARRAEPGRLCPRGHDAPCPSRLPPRAALILLSCRSCYNPGRSQWGDAPRAGPLSRADAAAAQRREVPDVEGAWALGVGCRVRGRPGWGVRVRERRAGRRGNRTPQDRCGGDREGLPGSHSRQGRGRERGRPAAL